MRNRALPEFVGPNSTPTSVYRPNAFKSRSAPPRTSSSGKRGGNPQGKDAANEGLTYTLPNSSIPFYLPPTSSRGGDVPGVLERWPASSSCGGEYGRDRDSARPPPFLAKIEKYISDEIAARFGRDCKDDKPGQYFEIYEEVFRFIISDFRTYQPILCEIKRQYDGVIRNQREQLKEIGKLKAELGIIHQTQAGKDQRRDHIQGMKCKLMQDTIESLTTTLRETKEKGDALDSQVARLSEALAGEHRRCIDERDGRILLVSEYHQLEVYKHTHELQQQEDRMKISTLKQRQQQLLDEREEHLHELEELRANRDANISIREHEDLKARLAGFIRMHEEVGLVVSDGSDSDRMSLQKLVKEAKGAEARAVREMEQWRRCSTPRPEWQRIGEILGPREKDQWLADIEGHSSQEILHMVAEHLDQMNVAKNGESQLSKFERDTFFEGLGMGPNIPAFLRYEGRVRKRLVPKREAEGCIRDIWKAKAKADRGKSLAQRTPLDIFFLQFLKKRLGVDKVVFEYAYNLYNAFQIYEYDADIDIFASILKGNISENVYHEQMTMMRNLSNAFKKADKKQSNPKHTGTVLPRRIVHSLIEGFFQTKTPERINDLKQALAKDFPPPGSFKSDSPEGAAQGGDMVDYEELFEENRVYDEGHFVEMVRDQHVEERREYPQKVWRALEGSQAVAGQTDYTKEHIEAAILKIDPYKEAYPELLKQYVARGFGQPYNKIKPDEKIMAKSFLRRMSAGTVAISARPRTKNPKAGISPEVEEELLIQELLQKHADA